jgi:hypothetical protein
VSNRVGTTGDLPRDSTTTTIEPIPVIDILIMRLVDKLKKLLNLTNVGRIDLEDLVRLQPDEVLKMDSSHMLYFMDNILVTLRDRDNGDRDKLVVIRIDHPPLPPPTAGVVEIFNKDHYKDSHYRLLLAMQEDNTLYAHLYDEVGVTFIGAYSFDLPEFNNPGFKELVYANIQLRNKPIMIPAKRYVMDLLTILGYTALSDGRAILNAYIYNPPKFLILGVVRLGCSSSMQEVKVESNPYRGIIGFIRVPTNCVLLNYYKNILNINIEKYMKEVINTALLLNSWRN